MNSPEILNWTEIRPFSSVQFRSKKFVPASSALSSVQFRSKKRGRIFWTRINAQKRSKTAKRPKTPQNAPKRPKNTRFLTWKRPFFFSSVQVQGQFSINQLIDWKLTLNLNWTEKKRAFSGQKTGVFGAFWGVLGRFWAFGGFWAFLGVYAGPKNATPFFWPELNWTERTTGRYKFFWPELNWTEWPDFSSVQNFRWVHMKISPVGRTLRDLLHMARIGCVWRVSV